MRLTLTLLLPCLLTLALPAQRPVTLTVTASGCQQAPRLFAFTGAGFVPVDTLEAGDADTYVLTLQTDETIFRYLGSSGADALPLLLGGEEHPQVQARCGAFRSGTVTDSPLNRAYTELKSTFQAFKERYDILRQDIEVVQNAAVNAEGRRQMAELDAEKLALVEQQRRIDPTLGRIAALNTFTSYYSADTAAYQRPFDHFVATYFDRVDFSDPGYDDLSWTYEAGRNYAQSVAQAIPQARLGDLLLAETSRWPAGGRARFLVRAGVLASLVPLKHPATTAVADAVIAEYRSAYPEAVADLERQSAALRSFTIGAPAPPFAGATPEGDTLHLEALRGKYVLLDFWASWCGPCRRENPNVVRVYDKYRDAGFEILGISLDDRRERWLQAIEADGLEWLHVSDLKGWRSEHAQLYGVTSIPQTVLLDPEGRIIARNLRGAQLESKLRELLGAK